MENFAPEQLLTIRDYFDTPNYPQPHGDLTMESIMENSQLNPQAKIIKEVPENGFTCPQCRSSKVNYVDCEGDGNNYERCTDCGHCWQPKGKPEEVEEVWEWNEPKPWLREIDS